MKEKALPFYLDLHQTEGCASDHLFIEAAAPKDCFVVFSKERTFYRPEPLPGQRPHGDKYDDFHDSDSTAEKERKQKSDTY